MQIVCKILDNAKKVTYICFINYEQHIFKIAKKNKHHANSKSIRNNDRHER